MDNVNVEDMVREIKTYIAANLPLSEFTDEELEEKIEDVVDEKLSGQYCSIDKRVNIVKQIFSSIRGFGILDVIMNDDDITEIMVNGPKNIFIEKKACCKNWIRSLKASGGWRTLSSVLSGLRGGKSTRPIPSSIPVCRTARVSTWYCRRLPCAGRRSRFESFPRPR